MHSVACEARITHFDVVWLIAKKQWRIKRHRESTVPSYRAWTRPLYGSLWQRIITDELSIKELIYVLAVKRMNKAARDFTHFKHNGPDVGRQINFNNLPSLTAKGAFARYTSDNDPSQFFQELLNITIVKVSSFLQWNNRENRLCGNNEANV